MRNIKKANYKDADQSVQMRRLVYAFVVRKTPENRFSLIEAHYYVEWCKDVVNLTLTSKIPVFGVGEQQRGRLDCAV